MPDCIPLKQRVFAASAWSLAGYGVNQAIRFGSNLIMTRLLVPEMFGVMAIATIVMVGLAMFSDLGLRQSLVQSRRGADPAFLNTAWVLQILRGFALWIMALAISIIVFLAVDVVPRDSVYADPSLPLVIAALSFGAVIGGLESTKLSEASRNLALGRVTQIEIATQIVGVLCMLAWAFFDRSIWALVVGSTIAALLRTALSHVSLRGNTNRWQWDRSAFVELVHFGKWIFLSSILGFLVNSGDRLLLGWMVDSTVLGVYVIAYLIFNSIEFVLMKVIGDVSFPALSEIARDRRPSLKANYYRIYVIAASVAYLSAGILMTSGQMLIALLYDPRYAQAGWMLQVLAAALLTVPIRLAVICLLALGMPQLHSHVIAIRAVVLYIAAPLGFHLLGLPGAIVAIVVSCYASLPVTVLYANKYDLFDCRKELQLLAALPVGVGVGWVFNLVTGIWL